MQDITPFAGLLPVVELWNRLHLFVMKARLEKFAEDVECRNSFFLVDATFLQKRAPFEGAEEGLGYGRDFVLQGSGLCCFARHGLPGVYVFGRYKITQKASMPLLFSGSLFGFQAATPLSDLFFCES